jgi:NRPS condensation-like uncharacterized protein
MKEKCHYQLDRTAKIFACIMTEKQQPWFRLSVILTESVNPLILQKALDNILPGFPYFTVVVKQGFFWSYFQKSDMEYAVKYDNRIPFSPEKKQKALLKVFYHDRKIGLEFHHILADGYGAMVFLKTLLEHYFTLKDNLVVQNNNLPHNCEIRKHEEYEDCMSKYCHQGKPGFSKGEKAYHISEKNTPDNELILTVGTMKIQDVLEKTHEYKVSVTEYLSTVLLSSLIIRQKEDKPKRLLPVKINVSVDLRKFYIARTLRNFSYYYIIGITPGIEENTFKSILEQVHRQSKPAITESNLNKRISENMQFFNIIDKVPLFIKKAFIRPFYSLFYESAFTCNLTNMGIVDLPLNMREKVERFDTLANLSRYIKLTCGIISCNDILSVAFINLPDSLDIQQKFFSMLIKEGIPVKMEHDMY